MINQLKNLLNIIIKLIPLILAVSINKYIDNEISILFFHNISKRWAILALALFTFATVILTLMRIGVIDELENGFKDEETGEFIPPTEENKKIAEEMKLFDSLYVPTNAMLIASMGLVFLNAINPYLLDWNRANIIFSNWLTIFTSIPIFASIVFILCCVKNFKNTDIKRVGIIFGSIILLISIVAFIFFVIIRNMSVFSILEISLFFNIIFLFIVIKIIKSKIKKEEELSILKTLKEEGIE